MSDQLTARAPVHKPVLKQHSALLQAQIPILLQDRLNVKNKSRSNVFNYRGQFTPELVEYLLQSFAQPDSMIVDPFSGSGTVLLESTQMGLGCFGLEINPAAYAMSKFFSFANDPISERRSLAEALEIHICSLADRLCDAPLFEPRPTFRDSYANFLDFCARLFSLTEDPKERLLAVNVLFLAEGCKRSTVGASVFSSFRQLRQILLDLPESRLPVHASLGDARQLDLKCPGRPDIILTSPPYINVFNYHQNFRAVLECLGWNLL